MAAHWQPEGATISWLSTFWDNNRNTLGNAVKNVAPIAAAFIPGLGPLAAAGLAGGGAALGEGMIKGKNIGDMLRTGASNAAIGGALNSGVGALKSAFVPSSAGGDGMLAATNSGVGQGAVGGPSALEDAAAEEAGGGLPISTADTVRAGAMPTAKTLGTAAASSPAMGSGAATPSGFWSGVGNAAGKAAKWAGDHPDAVAGLAKGIASIPTADAQARLIQQQADAARYDLARRQAMDPLKAAFGSQLLAQLQNPVTASANPYAGLRRTA